MELQIEGLLFKQISKPKHYVHNKIVNVYDNNYRINLYCEYEENNLTKKRICGSYFAKLVNKSVLQIVHSSDKV